MPTKATQISDVTTHKPKRPSARPTKKGKERSQQDHIWKEILSDLLELFMLFFFPDYYLDINWQKGYESLDKEMIEVSEEQGFSKQAADKLFKVFLKDGSEGLILLHVEVQGYKDDDFAERVRDYNYLIRHKYKQRVLSFAVLSDPQEDFRPTGYRWEYRRHLELYNFPMVKLLDYRQQWEQLEQSDNPFALVVMAHLQTQALKGRPIELKEAKFGLIKLLLQQQHSRQYVIKLLETINWLILLPPNLEAEYRAAVRKLTEEVKMPIVSSWALDLKAEGKKEGKKEGLQEGMYVLIEGLLEERFGKIESELKQQLEQLSVSQLKKLSRRLLSLSSKEELLTWLQTNHK